MRASKFISNAVWCLSCLALIWVPVAPAAEVRIRGLKTMTENEVLGLISGRLEFIRKREANPARADDAAFMLEQLLKQRGFNEPRVDWSLPNSSTIVLTVDEGQRSLVGEVTVQGLEDPKLAEEIKRQFRAAHGDQGELTSSEVFYLPSRNAQGLQDAQNLLKSKGYWKSSIDLIREARDARTSRVNLFLDGQPGPLHYLNTPGFRSTGSNPADLLAEVGAYSNRPATAENVISARRTVEDYYRDRGHQFSSVRMLVNHHDARTQLDFQVDPGKRFRVGDIRVAGAEKTRPKRISQPFERLKGQYYDGKTINKKLRALLGTGAFSGVQLNETPEEDSERIDLELEVTEGQPRGYYAYVGAGSFEGPIVGGGFFHRNLMGNLWNFTSRLEWSGLGLLGEASVTDPWFLGYDMGLTGRLFALTRDYEGYKKREAGAGLKLAWNATENYLFELSYQSSYVSTEPTGVPSSQLGETDYSLNRFSLSQTLDYRNDPLLPSDGWFAKLNTEFGLALGDQSVSYFRLEGLGSYFQPVTSASHLALKWRSGWLVPSGDQDDLPIDLRFFNGGANSVRSFPERELGPSVSGFPRGGQAYWSASAEYEHQIAGPVRAVAFLDAGALSAEAGDLFDREIKLAAGLGLRVNLPIGSLRLEYGHSLNRDRNNGDPAGAFHFAIGGSF